MQSLISIAFVLIVSLFCFFFSNHIDYRITALILLMTVSVTAMLFDIIPVLTTAFLSSLILNFFFIQPLFTFHITNTEDVLLFFMYLIIALVSAVLTYKIREAENKARDKEEKEKTIQLYDTLLNSLSHELRTPIATIIGAIDTLKENKNKLSQNNQTELLEEIDKASIRLNRQVENLLNMSRLETGTLKTKQDWCDLKELIYTVIEKIDVFKNEHIIDFVTDEQLPLFKLDIGLIEEIIRNLVLNAIQYSPNKSVIKIVATHQSEFCIISISDTGYGFPESEIEFAFDKFYRLPNTKTGGSGLGLSIVKGFVEAHNGTISLKNNPNSGACFTITIPSKTSYLNYLKNE
jgi:two-component system, OmpR family, sensor histidine kinase KdpD